MSRIKVEARASQKSLVFQPIDQDAGLKPQLLMPGEILSPGNSIGGFLTVPDTSGEKWGFWRIGGSTKDLLRDPDLRCDEVLINGVTRYIKEIKRITKSADPVAIARNRGRYLLAVSSGSARRGLLHYADRPSNPLLEAMRSKRISTGGIETVPSSDGIYLSSIDYMFPRFHRSEEIITDGETKVISERRGEEVDSRYDSRYPMGNEYVRESIQVSGSTFVVIAYRIQSEFNIGPNRPPLVGAKILLTPQADISKVAEIFSNAK